ncbi:ABC transporter permease [Paenibacillus sp. IB182496]|uniref:Transport permease protein n=1 Tax=Paenibacillus sabuli TaxID=2772509 RepID=A0A927GPW7_9BACL|nr:ABC transporter permease [Paenibacillus sabuli]MBD2843661.1 ABC transporter permease [Paenibacillus sabuli]
MTAFLKLTAFDFRLYVRDWITIFWVLIYPILILLLFGSMFGDSPGIIPGTRYIDNYVPALCAMNVMSVGLFTLNINMVNYRETGMLRRFRVTPLPRASVLASHATQGVVLILAGAVEIILIAKLVWNIEIGVAGIGLLAVCLLLGALGFFSLGFAMSGLSNQPGAASGIAMALFFPMMFLSGIAMPLEILPAFVRAASNWVPMTYFVTLVQGVWSGQTGQSYGLELLVLAGFAAVAAALAFVLFRWENNVN